LVSLYQRRCTAARARDLADKAQALRQHPTLSEQRLWAELRGSRLGVAFRRQVVISRYIADFVCPSRRLVVEVDGDAHLGRERLDAKRDAHLREAGYRVLRLPAALVMSNPAAATAMICAAL
jgi:very-short-patch-repair endonuclease